MSRLDKGLKADWRKSDVNDDEVQSAKNSDVPSIAVDTYNSDSDSQM